MPEARKVSNTWAIVVGGGSGQRFGELKQFASLRGRPLVEWSVSVCRSVCAGVVLVLPFGHTQSYGADIVVTGGKSRSESVRAGLSQVPKDAERVVIHDAVRPLASELLFEAVLNALDTSSNPSDMRVAGAVCALGVIDTVKEVDRSLSEPGGISRVVRTLDRECLVWVQTPQAFRANLLREAHESRVEVTDDASLLELLGYEVRVVRGDPNNLKITTPQDLNYAEYLLDRTI